MSSGWMVLVKAFVVRVQCLVLGKVMPGLRPYFLILGCAIKGCILYTKWNQLQLIEILPLYIRTLV